MVFLPSLDPPEKRMMHARHALSSAVECAYELPWVSPRTREKGEAGVPDTAFPGVADAQLDWICRT